MNRTLLNYYCVSHIGKSRSVNQDNYVCGFKYNYNVVKNPIRRCKGTLEITNCQYLGVFDGMGGGFFGEKASLIAAKLLTKIQCKNKECYEDILDYCDIVNQKICDYMEKASVPTMGTTVAILAFEKGRLLSLNVGDSKAFLFDGNSLHQLSKDHVLSIPGNSKPPLSQHLGIRKNELRISPHIEEHKYYNGDIYMLCTDGVTDVLTQVDIISCIKGSSISEAAENLVASAVNLGDNDDITVIVAMIMEEKG